MLTQPQPEATHRALIGSATSRHCVQSVHVRLQNGLTFPKSQSATRLLTPTTPNLATGRGTLEGIKLAAVLVTPFASFKIAAAVQPLLKARVA